MGFPISARRYLHTVDSKQGHDLGQEVPVEQISVLHDLQKLRITSP